MSSSGRNRRRDRRESRGGFIARHLDGWQAGAVAVLLAASAVFLAVPRAAEPTTTPVPLVDHAALQATMTADDELAALAEREVLDVDIRAVGRELRRYNGAVAHGNRQEAAAARRATVKATRAALRRDEQQLLALRAYQTKRFVTELRAWQQTGERSSELDELGGAFVELARLSRWCTGSGRELLADEAVLRTFFKKRWSETTGAVGGVFALTLDEDRTRFAFLMRYPMAPSGIGLPQNPTEELHRQAYDQRMRLAIVAKLGERDPTYPAKLAQGVMLYRMQRFAPAIEAFQQHLVESPDGQYALRAQNYLKAALDRAAESPL